jgi:hypothetical protein
MALAGALTALAFSAAAAGGAVNVKEKGEIKGKPADVWATVGGICAIKDWHPAIAACEESKEGGADYRTLTTKDGARIREKITAVGKDSYSYDIVESPLPVKSYSATFAMKPDDDDDDEVQIHWTASFDPADGKKADDAKDVIEKIFTDGIKGIKDAMKGKK